MFYSMYSFFSILTNLLMIPDLFLTNLTTHEDKLTHFNTFANELINDVHDQEIEGRTREVRSLWDDLMELAMARKEALVGAKKVHSFDKRIDDTLDWILEKEALLTIDVNCQDEETIQEMKQKQLGIRQDVKAINEQVIPIFDFGETLISMKVKDSINLNVCELESDYRSLIRLLALTAEISSNYS